MSVIRVCRIRRLLVINSSWMAAGCLVACVLVRGGLRRRLAFVIRIGRGRYVIGMVAVCLVGCRLVRRGVAGWLAFVIRLRRGGSMFRRGRRRTRLLGRHGWRLIRSACGLGCYYTLPVKFAGLGSGRDRRASVVCGREVLFILAGHVFVLGLRRERFGVMLVLRDFFFVGGTGNNPALATVEGHVRLVADDDGSVDIDVGDVDRVHMHHGGVVVERASAPFSATKTDAAVAEAIVHSAVEADVRAPITT